MKQPKISVCVPVYNNEKYVSAFIESVISQDYSDYELVMVDNQSTDGALEIMQKYAQEYPDIISIYRTDIHGNIAKGRNLAFKQSKGKYIYCCDSDDLMHPGALRRIGDAIDTYNADVYIGWAIYVNEENGIIKGVHDFQKKNTKIANMEEAILEGQCFWLHVIKRELFELFSPIPEDVIIEDMYFIPVLKSFASSIVFLDIPFYYYFRRCTSTSMGLNRELCESFVSSSKHAIECCNETCVNAVELLVMRVMNGYTNTRWQYYDVWVDFINEISERLYENVLIRGDEDALLTLNKLTHASNSVMPCVIYIDGFTSPKPNKTRLDELSHKVFHNDTKVITLSTGNCDIYENRYVYQAYQNGHYELVADYFALKYIYESGGIFIHSSIRILNLLCFLRYQNAFFSIMGKDSYSDKVFGSPKGNESIKDLLLTFSEQWDKDKSFMPLSERISIILTGKYKIPLDGRGRLFGDVVSTLSPELGVVDSRFNNSNKTCFFEQDYSDKLGDPDYVVLRRDTLETLVKPSSDSALLRRVANLEKEAEQLHNRPSYQVMLAAQRIAEGTMGSIIKKGYHLLLHK